MRTPRRCIGATLASPPLGARKALQVCSRLTREQRDERLSEGLQPRHPFEAEQALSLRPKEEGGGHRWDTLERSPPFAEQQSRRVHGNRQVGLLGEDVHQLAA